MVSRPSGGGLAVEFNVGATAFTLHTFRTRIGTITRETGLNALIARLLGCGRARGGRGALSPGITGGGQRFFAGVAFVNVSREQITSSKLISTKLAFVRPVAGVGTHMAGDMLGTGESGLANGTFVVSSHCC